MSQAMTPSELHAYWGDFYRNKDHVGLASLYEEAAVVIAPDGRRVEGREAIERLYLKVISAGAALPDTEQLPSVINNDVAITAMRLGDGGMTCEIARRQDDGSWLWAIDIPRFATSGGTS